MVRYLPTPVNEAAIHSFVYITLDGWQATFSYFRKWSVHEQEANINVMVGAGTEHFPFFLFALAAAACVHGSKPTLLAWINPCVELGGREHAPCLSDA